MPRAVVVTNLDKERADFDETVAVCQRVFTGGGGILPLFLPLHGDDGTVAGFIDLLDEEMWDWSCRHRLACARPRTSTARSSTPRAASSSRASSPSPRTSRSWTASSAGEHVDIDLLTTDLERAVARGHFHPVMGHAVTAANVGSELILDLIVRGFPSPVEHPLPTVTRIDGSPATPLSADPAGPLCAEVIKTTSDPYVGKVSIVRVFSGTLAQRRRRPRVRPLRRRLGPRGPRRRRAHRPPHRDARQPAHRHLRRPSPAASSRSASSRGPRRATPCRPRTPRCSWSRGACRCRCCPSPSPPHSAGDEDKLGTALGRVAAEDPTLRIEHPEETGQIVLWTLGEAHADLIVDRHQDAVRRRGRRHGGARLAARDLLRARRGQRPARQAVRRPRPVRGRRHHRRAAAGGLAGSSSSTRSSAAPSPATTSRPSRRASASR